MTRFPDYLAVTAESMYDARLCKETSATSSELFPGRFQNHLPT